MAARAKVDAGGRLVRDVELAFIRLHVLHHAAEGPIFGLAMMEELDRHGYDIGPGTLYPLLHGLEANGVLQSVQEIVDGKARRYYRTTKAGDRVLAELRDKVAELVGEVGPSGRERGRKGPRHA
jgi:DNA-binding PadR family transcriptional regulator